MLADEGVHMGMVQHTRRNHLFGAAVRRIFFRGLENQLDGSGKPIAQVVEDVGGPQQHGCVGIMSAGVGDAGILRGKGKAGTFGDGQGVKISPKAHASIIVASVARQPFDIEVFRSHGLTPSDFHILVVKSSVHYRASFGPYAKKMLSVECPGILKIDPRQLPYVNVRRPIYPLDEAIELQ